MIHIDDEEKLRSQILHYGQSRKDISEEVNNLGRGAKLVEQLSKELKNEYLDVKGFSLRNLRYMRDFYFIIYLQAVFFTVLSFNSSLIVIVIFSALICVSSEILFSVSDNIIQQYISSSYRATILSIVSLIRSLVASILYIVLGYLFNLISFKTTFIFIALTIFTITSVALIFWVIILKKYLTLVVTS